MKKVSIYSSRKGGASRREDPELGVETMEKKGGP
jgi:hypothetical protein